MKSGLTILLFACICTCTFAQTNKEFRTHENGLMYSDADMKQLRYLVDSLNLRFKKCEARTFYSMPQTWIYELRFTSKDNPLTDIKKDIENNISYAELIQRYATFLKDADTLLCIFNGKNEKGKNVYTIGNASDGYNYAWFRDQEVSKGKWVFNYSPKGEYTTSYTLNAAYCPEQFKQVQLPMDYAAYIQYVDCMVDTTASIYLSTATEAYGATYRSASGSGSIESKKKELTKLRNSIVVGSCSQDESPRRHALNIALLAAETHSWDIFLRAHLDIMNDNFSRVSDGSYAWNKRETYLKELEELNLNVIDLMIGLTLRADNTASNHYYGAVWRIGWALTESKDRKLFEATALKMMKDAALDEFNRGLMMLLYQSYAHRLDKKETAQIIRNIKADVQSFPTSLQGIIKAWQEPKN